jgi:hypothetical protein
MKYLIVVLLYHDPETSNDFVIDAATAKATATTFY